MRFEASAEFKKPLTHAEQVDIVTLDATMENLERLLAQRLNAELPTQTVSADELIELEESQIDSVLKTARFVVMQIARGADYLVALYDTETNRHVLTMRLAPKLDDPEVRTPQFIIEPETAEEPVVREAHRILGEAMRELEKVDIAEALAQPMPEGWKADDALEAKTADKPEVIAESFESPHWMAEERPRWSHGETVYSIDKDDPSAAWLGHELGLVGVTQEEIFLNGKNITPDTVSVVERVVATSGGVLAQVITTEGNGYPSHKVIMRIPSDTSYMQQLLVQHPGEIDGWKASKDGIAKLQIGQGVFLLKATYGDTEEVKIGEGPESKSKQWVLDGDNHIFYYDPAPHGNHHIIRQEGSAMEIHIPRSQFEDIKGGYFGFMVKCYGGNPTGVGRVYLFSVPYNGELVPVCKLPSTVTDLITEWHPHPGKNGYDGILARIENDWVFYCNK